MPFGGAATAARVVFPRRCAGGGGVGRVCVGVCGCEEGGGVSRLMMAVEAEG